jgi:hypothetical protein
MPNSSCVARRDRWTRAGALDDRRRVAEERPVLAPSVKARDVVEVDVAVAPQAEPREYV